MSDLVKQLRAISCIKDVQEIRLDQEIQDRLLKQPDGESRLRTAKFHQTKVQIARMSYSSQAHLVIGFVLRPKAFVGKLPCIIYNRGGSGEFGKISTEALFLRLARMASWGYIVIASQYSGNDGGEGKDEMGGEDLEDVLTLYKILKAYPEADLTRIGMFGTSRGGMMTYLCLAKVKWLKAAVSMAGLADLFRQEKLRPDMKAHLKNFFKRSTAELERRSAVRWVHKFHKKTPVLLMHGSADWRVSPLDSLDLSREMLKEKIPHRLVMLEGGDHSLSEFHELRLDMVKKWFDRFVKERGLLPNLKLHGD